MIYESEIDREGAIFYDLAPKTPPGASLSASSPY